MVVDCGLGTEPYLVLPNMCETGISILQIGRLRPKEGHTFNLGLPGSKTHACA